jgi:hypothetical protein
MNDLFKDVTSFGQNCFNVQIGRGSKAVEAIAFFNEYAVPEAERAPWLEAF